MRLIFALLATAFLAIGLTGCDELTFDDGDQVECVDGNCKPKMSDGAFTKMAPRDRQVAGAVDQSCIGGLNDGECNNSIDQRQSSDHRRSGPAGCFAFQVGCVEQWPPFLRLQQQTAPQRWLDSLPASPNFWRNRWPARGPHQWRYAGQSPMQLAAMHEPSKPNEHSEVLRSFAVQGCLHSAEEYTSSLGSEYLGQRHDGKAGKLFDGSRGCESV